MTMTLHVTLQTPASEESFDQLLKVMIASGSHSSHSTRGGRGFDPNVMFAFSDDGKAIAAADLAKTFPFVESAEAKHPPARFGRGGRYIRRMQFEGREIVDVFAVLDRSREFVTLRCETSKPARFKVKRDDDGNEFVELGKAGSCTASLYRLHAKSIEPA
jgi:hypothetical protein